jgi:hypothetical protein
MIKDKDPASAIRGDIRRRFTQRNRLPMDKERLIIKRIGRHNPFEAVIIDEPFSVQDPEGHVRYLRSGSYLVKTCSQDGGLLFGITEDEFKQHYIDF